MTMKSHGPLAPKGKLCQLFGRKVAVASFLLIFFLEVLFHSSELVNSLDFW